MGPFGSSRAEEQVVAVLDYAAYPGLAVLVDGAGRIVARAGSAIGLELATLGRVLAKMGALTEDESAEEPLVRSLPTEALPAGALPDRYTVLYGVLPHGFKVCVVAPMIVSLESAQSRLDRARERLSRMMGGSTPGQPGPEGAAAHADLFWAEAPPEGEYEV